MGTEYLRAEIQHMADAEILSMVDPQVLERIKQSDSHPVIKVFGIGHEGPAKGSLVGAGARVFHYVKEAIRRLHDRVQVGLATFNRHAQTNDHAGRQKIGEVVGKKLIEVGGKAYSMAAIYLFPQFRDAPLDVASVETNVQYALDSAGEAMVSDIESVTGIALSSREVDLPGFPGATLLGAMQAFQVTHSKEGTKMTKEEIKSAISEGKLKPGDLFDKDTLVADSVVLEYIRTEKQTEYEHAKRVEKKLGEEREARMADSKTHEAEIASLRQKAILSTAGTVLGSLITERKLDERQSKFVNSHLTDFKTEAADETGVRKDLNSWIDGQLTQYKSIAEIFGVKDDSGQGAGGAAGLGAANREAAGNSKSDVDPLDLTLPENNPLIPV